MEAEDYSLEVFNADETGLWWKLMPSKSFVHCGEAQAKISRSLKIESHF